MLKLFGDEALRYAVAVGAQLYVKDAAVSVPEAVAHSLDAPGEVSCEQTPPPPAVLHARAVSHCRGVATNLVQLHQVVDHLSRTKSASAARALTRACMCFVARSEDAVRRLGQCAAEACRTPHTLPERLPDPLYLARGTAALLADLWQLQRNLQAHPLDPHHAAESLVATLSLHQELQVAAALALCDPCRALLVPRIGGDPCYLCGRCGRLSFNPVDAQERYCPSCRRFEGDDVCE